MENIEQFVSSLRENTKDIKEKDLGNNISSFNFSRDVFFSDNWNAINKVARGLFIDVKNFKIVARSYEKFFQIDENGKNTYEWLSNNLKFPVCAYEKYNGFLGLMSWNHAENDFFIATKSTNQGDYVGYFKKILNKYFNHEFACYNNFDVEKLKKYLQNNDVTLVFEVIDFKNDPHIIEYNCQDVILLDIIDNTINFNKLPYKQVLQIGEDILKFKVKCQESYMIESIDDLKFFISQHDKEDIEGFVFEDKNNYMFKWKTPFYQTWKHIRSLRDRISNDKNINLDNLSYKDNMIVDFMKSYYKKDQLKSLSIIDIRKDFFKKFSI